MPGKHIWIVEDDSESRMIFQEILELRYSLEVFESLRELRLALTEAKRGARVGPDLILADLRLGDGNFLEFLGIEETATLLTCPFIVISSYDDVDILRACFDEGAMDYLTKPFAKAELIVKIERILRAAGKAEPEPGPERGSWPGIRFDPEILSVGRDGQSPVQLTARELRIFWILYRARGELVSRQQIKEQVWPNALVSGKTLDVHIFNLRAKLRGVSIGIRFMPPDFYVLMDEQVGLSVGPR